jgi:FKBP-type peptidyl-prolyl cis-trans isomerase FklB
MKSKIILSVLGLSACLSVTAQTPAAAPVKKTPPAAHGHPVARTTRSLTLKTTQDTLSYAIGLSVANFYKQQEITGINTALVLKAINDVNRKTANPKDTLLINEQQANACISGYMQKAKAAKASGNKKIGEDFLAANKSKPGVVTTPSGLQYMVMKEGTGAKPALTDKVKCHYHGTLLDGRVFDSSVDRGQPIELNVNGVIPGWTEALQMMPVGSKWKLFVPSNLAYGDQQMGPLIAPGSTLIFEVELLDIGKEFKLRRAPRATANFIGGSVSCLSDI